MAGDEDGDWVSAHRLTHRSCTSGSSYSRGQRTIGCLVAPGHLQEGPKNGLREGGLTGPIDQKTPNIDGFSSKERGEEVCGNMQMMLRPHRAVFGQHVFGQHVHVFGQHGLCQHSKAQRSDPERRGLEGDCTHRRRREDMKKCHGQGGETEGACGVPPWINFRDLSRFSNPFTPELSGHGYAHPSPAPCDGHSH